MFKRIFPTLIALGLGFTALIWGLVNLQMIFMHERDDAIAAIATKKNALEQYAQKTLEQNLEQKLRRVIPDIEKAIRDPLIPDEQLLLTDNATQKLPRIIRYRQGSETVATNVYMKLKEGDDIGETEEPDSPWVERLSLLKRFNDAMRSGNRGEIEKTFKTVLSHRLMFSISVRKDVPYMIVLLESFMRKSDPDPTLLRYLVRDGLKDARGLQMEGLQRLLLRKRDKFTQKDFRFLSDKLIEISKKAHVRYEDFKNAVARIPSATLDVQKNIIFPALLFEGAWYAEKKNGAIMGVKTQLDELLLTITNTMYGHGLLKQGDAVAAGKISSLAQSLESFSLSIKSAQWNESYKNISQRYFLKTILVAACGILGAIIGALAVVAQWRKSRYLELKSDFISTVSHELRTPLASIRLLAETIQRRFSKSAEASDYPARIIKEIDGLSFLIENILSFNRLNKGGWILRKGDVHLEEIFEWMKAETPLYSTTDVNIATYGIKGVSIDADPEMIKLLFLNLARNACMYNNRNPVEITINARNEHGVAIRFSDNGVGIPISEHENIFSEFCRPAAKGEIKRRGSGLGLAICRKIMTEHKGTIKIISSEQDGTTFEITFPQ